MPWRSFSAAREEAVTGRAVLRGTPGMIGANSGIMRTFSFHQQRELALCKGQWVGWTSPFQSTLTIILGRWGLSLGLQNTEQCQSRRSRDTVGLKRRLG